MSDRTDILRDTFSLEQNPERMERVRAYEEQLRSGAEPALAGGDDLTALMEAFARVAGGALRGQSPIQRRGFLNFLAHRAELHAKGG